MTDKEPLKITLEDLEGDEKPAAAERTPGRVREGAEQAGQKVAGAVKDSAAKVTQKIGQTAGDITSRSAEAMRDKVSETVQAQGKATADAIEARLREVDWKAEAQKGAEGTLRWLSQRLEQLAERVKTDDAAAPGPDDEKQG